MTYPITLATPLSLPTSFRFPLQCQRARREVLLGAALLILLPGVGWIWNMGHRIEMVHRMQHGQPAWQVAGFSFASAFTHRYQLRSDS